MPAQRSIHLKVAYDGTAYSGWQIQSRDPTVQGRLMDAVAEMEGQPTKVFGAGRTDAGVHARGQGASFRTDSAIPERGYVMGINAKLPADIAVLEATALDVDFHARFSARGKHYRYSIWNAPTRQPLMTRFALHRWKSLDAEAMDRAARLLEGEHDFNAYRAADCERENAVRRLWHLRVTRHPNLVRIDVEGTAFLKHMVRTIAGSLMEVGLGKHPPGWISEVLASGDRRQAGPTAPPQGLCLERVYYPELGDQTPSEAPSP